MVKTINNIEIPSMPNLYFIKSKNLLKYKSFYKPKIKGYIINNKYEKLDIDNVYDYNLAKLYSKKIFHNENS